jgi:hypothetical protein
MRKHFLLLLLIAVALTTDVNAQNVGIGTTIPQEKLQVENGQIKIGRNVLGSGQLNLLKFGDGDFVTIGETEADDQMSLYASYFLFRSNGGFGGRVGINVPSGVPTAQLEVNGTVKITDGLEGTGKVLTSDASGLASWLPPASGSGAFKALVTSTQNITSGGNTSIIYTTKDYDDATAFFSTQYIAPSNGLYHFDVAVNWDINPVAFNTRYDLILTVNGAVTHAAFMELPSGAGFNRTQQINCDIKLTAGQTVSVLVSQNSGILQPILGTTSTLRYSYFSGRRVN